MANIFFNCLALLSDRKYLRAALFVRKGFVTVDERP